MVGNRGITIGSVMITLIIFAAVSFAFIGFIANIQGNYGDIIKEESSINNETDMEQYNRTVHGLKGNMEGMSGDLESGVNATETGDPTAQLLWLGVSGSFRIVSITQSMFGVVGGVISIAGTTLNLPPWATGIILTSFGVIIAILIWRILLSETRI